MQFEHFIHKGTKKLRMGFTTGTCAALAAKAAVEMLLTGLPLKTVGLMTPKGLPVTVPVLKVTEGGDWVSCAVQKDAGDDPDQTDGLMVFAKASKTAVPGIKIEGGMGVGRVTKPGLDQPVGVAAINRVPRKMIMTEVQTICDRYGYTGGMTVTISAPEGIEIAKRTFNPKLGIEGGISILGTSGIVEPQSTQALIDCIGLELRALSALGHKSVILTPGNYGEDFLRTHSFLAVFPTVKCSNYIGDALDFSIAYGFRKILLVGHIGKFVKLAGAIMNTHSNMADCRRELFAAHAAYAGAEQNTIIQLMNAISTDACIEILDKAGLRKDVLSSLLRNIQFHITERVKGNAEIGAVLFSNVHGFLGQTETVSKLIARLQRRENP